MSYDIIGLLYYPFPEIFCQVLFLIIIFCATVLKIMFYNTVTFYSTVFAKHFCCHDLCLKKKPKKTSFVSLKWKSLVLRLKKSCYPFGLPKLDSSSIKASKAGWQVNFTESFMYKKYAFINSVNGLVLICCSEYFHLPGLKSQLHLDWFTLKHSINLRCVTPSKNRISSWSMPF